MNNFISLNSKKDFSNVYRNAKKWYCDCAVVYFLANGENKFSVVVSKKIGKAVVRNYCKRRVRAVFNEVCSELKSGTYVIVVKFGLDKIPFKNVRDTIKWALRKMDSFK